MSTIQDENDKKHYLGPKGYSIKKKFLSIQEQNSIRQDLMVKSFVPPSSIQQPVEFLLYRESIKKIYVPRFYGINTFGIPDDITIKEGNDINIHFAGELRDYQKNIINTFLTKTKESGCGLLEIPCGRGKCLGKNTKILLYDGTVKNVQDIKEGDILKGDDGGPRIVYGLTHGHGKMYSVNQSHGMNYSVNSDHIITIYNTNKKCLQDINVEKLYDLLLHTDADEYMFGARCINGKPILSHLTISLLYNETEYFGFCVDANHRFVLEDGTITHNTVMGLNIISQLQKKTLVIVHKEFLMNQWIERIQQFLPNARIGKIQGQIANTKDKDIVLGMLQSLSMKEYPQHIFDEFGLTIVDECFPKGTMIYTSHGILPIEDVVFKYEKHQNINLSEHSYIKNVPTILSFNQISKSFEWKTITHTWKRKKRKLVKISVLLPNFKETMVFRCTPEHKLLLWDCLHPLQTKYVSASSLFGLENRWHDGSVYIVGTPNLMEVYSTNPIKHICESGGIMYKVWRVEEEINIENKEYDVYDIEIEKNHNFIVCHKVNDYTIYGFVVSNCHHISAEVFCRSLFKIVTPYMLGLSATMNRKDGLTKVFKLFLGDVIYKEQRKTDDNVLVKVIQYTHCDPEFSQTHYNFKGQTHYTKMISQISTFNPRTEFIIQIVKDILKENNNHQIMILAQFKSILKYLYDAIDHRNIASVGYYVGGMKEHALKETETKKVVIATYAMAEEALDIKTLSCLIMATPRSDVTQAVGRILRVKHLDKQPLVFDIVDQHDIFQKQFIKRRRFYMKCNYKIIQTVSKTYNEKKWDVLFHPNERKKYTKKIKSQEEDKNMVGKCVLDFPK